MRKRLISKDFLGRYFGRWYRVNNNSPVNLMLANEIDDYIDGRSVSQMLFEKFR